MKVGEQIGGTCILSWRTFAGMSSPAYVPTTLTHGRPAAWSSSSTIFTAHPSQPMVIGHLFPSSKQFLVVSPDPILRSPASYEPPTVISVSPNDHWLFAFFPSYQGDGIACLWKRGPCVDAWIVKEYWQFSRGAGVITCAWAGTEREVRRLIFPVQTGTVIHME